MRQTVLPSIAPFVSLQQTIHLTYTMNPIPVHTVTNVARYGPVDLSTCISSDPVLLDTLVVHLSQEAEGTFRVQLDKFLTNLEPKHLRVVGTTSKISHFAFCPTLILPKDKVWRRLQSAVFVRCVSMGLGLDSHGPLHLVRPGALLDVAYDFTGNFAEETKLLRQLNCLWKSLGMLDSDPNV